MKHYCHYHPTSQAVWHCQSCELYFDKLCIPEGDEKLQQAQCPQCHTAMKFLEKHRDMAPFWTKPGRFLTLPFKADPLLLCIATSLFSLATALHPVLTILLCTVISLVISNYALILARGICNANRSATQIHANDLVIPSFISAFNFKAAKDTLVIALVLWLAFAPVVLLLYFVNGIGAAIYAFLALPLLPGILLMLIHTDSRRGAKQSRPPSAMDIVKKMHGNYVVLLTYFALSFLSALLVVDLCQALLPPIALAPMVTFSGSYLAISLFAALGLVMKRYDSFDSAELSDREYDKGLINTAVRLNADLDIAVKDGNYAKAIDLLETSLKKGRSDLRVHQLYTLLLEHKDLEGLEKRSHLFLELLLGRGQKLAAYELVEQLRNGREKFQIHDLDLSLELAKAFFEMKEYKLALWLAQDAHTRFDAQAPLAELYLLSAKIIFKSTTPGKARGLLKYVCDHFPDTEYKQNANALLQCLK